MTSAMDLREGIPGLEDGVYLNYGAHGPSPRAVVEAADEFTRHHEYDVPLDSDPYEVAFEEYEKTRERVALFLGARPEEIALTESTTAGIAAAAAALDWEPGDVVVRTDVEHPAGILPWERLEREGVEVRVVETEDGRIDRDEFAAAVADAKLACFSALTWTHGTRLPVSDLVDIAHDAGALALVDAVQVPGQYPMDVSEWGADVVAAAGHKWLLGLWGSGFLYVDAEAMDAFEPAAVGYRSVKDSGASPFEFAPGASRFEVGTTNPAAHVALRTAMDRIDAVGVERVESRIQELTGRLADAVPDDRLLGPAQPESGLVSLNVPDAESAVERLRDEGIVVRSLPLPDTIRASIHAVTTEQEVDAFADAVADEW